RHLRLVAVIIEQALDERPCPQLILVCTDGWTPWPTENNGVPIVACITGKLADLPNCYRPPNWITTLELGA
ncbi:MAG: hypothetical protein ACI9HK_004686, partial [Pirellulaceae bacterium]